MTYHTNHCFCLTSNWGGEPFHGEVMVDFPNYISTDTICNYKHKIPDPDFINLTTTKEFTDITARNNYIKVYTDMLKEKGLDITKIPKHIYYGFEHNIPVLKDYVISWLNDNIKEVQGDYLTEADKKGWCVGSDEYTFNNRESRPIIFFSRQVDALKFIRKFSVFKVPTFYFDYFHDERKELHSSIILKELNLNEKDFVFDNKQDTSTDMDYYTFKLLDWEKDDEECIDLDNDELKLAVKDILSVD